MLNCVFFRKQYQPRHHLKKVMKNQKVKCEANKDIAVDNALLEASRGGELLILNKRPAKKTAIAQASLMSKGMRRRAAKRQKKVEEERQRKLQRIETLDRLKRNRVSDDHLKCLSSSAKMGQVETQKQRVSRQLRMERNGIDLTNIDGTGKGLYIKMGIKSEGSELLHRTSANCVKKTSNGNKMFKQRIDQTESLNNIEIKPMGTEKANEKKRSEIRETRKIVSQNLEELIKINRSEIGIPMVSKVNADERMKKYSDSIELELKGAACVVHVNRSEEIQAKRTFLPILSQEQEIVESILKHDINVLCGETGSGKTTQLPQFLYEVGFGSKEYPHRSGMIGVTQPRRIAATSTASRVSEELGYTHHLDGKHECPVGFQIRHNRCMHEGTAIKFMTDGILLREVQHDFLLRAYSVIIIDEAHERTVNTDILIGLLSRIVPMRRRLFLSSSSSENYNKQHIVHLPLKLIIMSATLRVEDFVDNENLFPSPPPLISVPARQHPVTVHFSRRTELRDYLTAVLKKASAIHRRLPPGGILIFVTGQREVEYVCRQLETTFSSSQRIGIQSLPVGSHNSSNVVDKSTELDLYNIDDVDGSHEDTKCNDIMWKHDSTWGGEQDEDEDEDNSESDIEDWEEEEFEKSIWGVFEEKEERSSLAVEILPLYAMLPVDKQRRVFSASNPTKIRRVVVATNVAETSLTIPGIRYVVDCGRSKQATYQSKTGMANFEVRWISQASAEQRSGRAGRTGPGHCYRIYSSAAFNDIFPKHSSPDICRVPLEGVILNMKAMGIEKVVNFPFPSPPKYHDVVEGERVLTRIGAIDTDTKLITELGKIMSHMAVSPRHSRTLIAAFESDERGVSNGCSATCLQYSFAVVSALAMDSPFIRDLDSNNEGSKEKRKNIIKERRKYDCFKSDAISIASMLIQYDRQGRTTAFCEKLGLHGRIMREMSDLRRQLVSSVERLSFFKDVVNLRNLPICAPSPSQQAALRAAICCGWADRVARMIRNSSSAILHGNTNRKRIPYRSSFLPEDEVYINSHSAVLHDAPDYVVYTELVEKKYKYMYGITAIEPKWLATCAPSMVTMSPPLESPRPFYDNERDMIRCWHKVSYGPEAWPLPNVTSECTEDSYKFAVFGIELLKGKVVHQLKISSDKFTFSPDNMYNSEGRGQPCAKSLLSALIAKKVASRQLLKMEWMKDSNYLFNEIRLWLYPKHCTAFLKIWNKAVNGLLNVSSYED